MSSCKQLLSQQMWDYRVLWVNIQKATPTLSSSWATGTGLTTAWSAAPPCSHPQNGNNHTYSIEWGGCKAYIGVGNFDSQQSTLKTKLSSAWVVQWSSRLINKTISRYSGLPHLVNYRVIGQALTTTVGPDIQLDSTVSAFLTLIIIFSLLKQDFSEQKSTVSKDL